MLRLHLLLTSPNTDVEPLVQSNRVC